MRRDDEHRVRRRVRRRRARDCRFRIATVVERRDRVQGRVPVHGSPWSIERHRTYSQPGEHRGHGCGPAAAVERYEQEQRRKQPRPFAERVGDQRQRNRCGCEQGQPHRLRPDQRKPRAKPDDRDTGRRDQRVHATGRQQAQNGNGPCDGGRGLSPVLAQQPAEQQEPDPLEDPEQPERLQRQHRSGRPDFGEHRPGRASGGDQQQHRHHTTGGGRGDGESPRAVRQGHDPRERRRRHEVLRTKVRRKIVVRRAEPRQDVEELAGRERRRRQDPLHRPPPEDCEPRHKQDAGRSGMEHGALQPRSAVPCCGQECEKRRRQTQRAPVDAVQRMRGGGDEGGQHRGGRPSQRADSDGKQRAGNGEAGRLEDRIAQLGRVAEVKTRDRHGQDGGDHPAEPVRPDHAGRGPHGDDDEREVAHEPEDGVRPGQRQHLAERRHDPGEIKARTEVDRRRDEEIVRQIGRVDLPEDDRELFELVPAAEPIHEHRRHEREQDGERRIRGSIREVCGHGRQSHARLRPMSAIGPTMAVRPKGHPIRLPKPHHAQQLTSGHALRIRRDDCSGNEIRCVV